MLFVRFTIHKISLSLLFFLFVSSCIYAQDRSNYALLWEIQHKDDSKKSYLFGTMHLKDKRVFDFSDALLPAIKQSEVFALELNPETIEKDLDGIDLYKDFSAKYKEILDEEDYERLKQKIKEKTGDELEDLYANDPDYLESVFRPDLDKEDDKDIFLDLYLYQIAASLDKEIDGLEELEDQITDYSTTTDEELKEGILELINYSEEEYRENLNEMIDVYVSGDLSKIDTFIKTYSGYDDVLERRNRVMVTSIASITKNKSLFAAIGAAHLPGETGVINLLREEGYTVKKVENIFTGASNNFVIQPKLDEWVSYTDSLHGYTLRQPSSVQKIELGESEEKDAYVDLKSGTIFFHFGLDMRAKSKSLIENAPDNFVKNLVSKDSTAILVNKEVTRGGELYRQIIIKGQSLNKVNHFELISKNGFFYVFGMEYNQNNNIAIAESFFENITFQKPELENSLWQPFVHKKGAFSVKMPGEVTENIRETPNPLDPEGDPYKINMYLGQDKANEYSYIVRYNNYPVGYYLQNIYESSEVFVDQIEQSTGAKILRESKSTHNGYDVYDYEMKLQDKYHSIIRYIFRDSRTYILLAQSTNENGTVSFDNPVFNSFEFTEYQSSSFKRIDDNKGKYSFLFPDTFRSENDTIRQYDTYIGDSKTYYGLDENSGGCYSINVSDLKKYFKLSKNGLEVFFDEYAEAYKEYGDSIYKQESSLNEEYPTKEYYIKSSKTPVLKRHKFMLINNRLVVLSVYLGEEEIESQKAEQFFNGVTMEKQKPFDLYTSKASLIMKDIRSKDSITRYEANGALDYYEFEASDKTLLEKGLSREYINDTTYYGTKNLLIYNLGLIGDTKTVSKLASYYKSGKAQNINKLMTFAALATVKSKEANEVYFDLLENNPPERIRDEYFPVFDSDVDSILSYHQYGDRILGFMNKPLLRDNIISYWTRVTRKDSTAIQFLNGKEDILFNFLNKDIIAYKNTPEKERPLHLIYGDILENYMSLLDKLDYYTPEIRKSLIELIQISDDNGWYVLKAFEHYVTHEDIIDPEIVKSITDELYYRFEAMEVLVNTDKTSLIPKEIMEERSFAELSLYNTIGNYYGYPNEIIFIDEMTHNNEKYIAFRCDYVLEDSDDESYLGLVKTNTIDFENFKQFTSYYSSEVLEDDWKNQAIEMLTPDEEKE